MLFNEITQLVELNAVQQRQLADLETQRDQTIQYYANIYPDFPDDGDDTSVDPLMRDVLTGHTVAPTSHIGGEFEDVMESLRTMQGSYSG